MGELPGPFVVDLNLMLGLKSEQAVELFRDLLIAEAVQIVQPSSVVDVPSAINAADGGVDASVIIPNGAALPVGLIADGATYYQIKTGAFSPTSASQARSLLIQPKHSRVRKLMPNHMQPRVKACLDKGGTFVTVLFGAEAVSTEEDAAENNIRAELSKIDAKYADAKLRIVRANQIQQAIQLVAPALAMKLNGLAGAAGAPLQRINYLEKSANLIHDYKPTEALEKAEQTIRDAVDGNSKFAHIRLLGDAGAGKTHLC